MENARHWIRMLAAATLLLCAQGSASARTVTVSTSATPGAAASPASALASAPVTASFFAPQLSVRGQRAVYSLRADSDLVLSVAYGETTALAMRVTEAPRAGAAPILKGAQPTLVVHQARLDGLAMDRRYYYRATLARAGAVVADSGVRSFDTPLAFVRVQPIEIDMHKDGDHDVEVSVGGQELYDNDNEGEVYLEWSVKLRAEPGGFPWSPKEKGCYPGGVSIPTSFPTSPPDLGDGTQQPAPGQQDSDVQYPNLDTTDAGNAPDGWETTGACIPYSYSDPVDVKEAKIGSGDSVELDPERYPALEWEMPAVLGATGAVGQAIAPDADGDGEPDWVPSGSASTPCADAPPGSYALVKIGVRGQEFDTAPGIGTTAGSLAELTRIINHDASESDVVCLDLREPAQTVRFGVSAEDGAFSFTQWFDVTLEYR